MLEQLFIILQKKYPHLAVCYYSDGECHIYNPNRTFNRWVLTINDTYIRDHTFRNIDISPASPDYFQEIDKIINNYQRIYDEIDKLITKTTQC